MHLVNIPDARVKYIPAETFINDFLEHLRLGEMESFKRTYRSLDLLLIDDIQSLGGKKVSTQEEFFNTFNALHGDNKQIVLTSDRSPDHLDNLEERLVTRFKWGLTQNITPPDFETRIAILRNKIELSAGFNKPEIVCMVVVLPAPLAPISVTISPSLTSKEIPLIASIIP